MTYRVGQSAAVSAAPPYTSEWQPTDATGDAEVDGRDRITVAAHGSRTVTVHIRQPQGVAEGTLFGGWVELTRTGSAAPEIRVPYLGMAGDFDAVSAINPTFTSVNKTLDNPALRPGYFTFGKNVPTTVDLTDTSTANDKAWVMLSHGFPLLERMRLQVLDTRGKVIDTPYDASWVTRNSGAGTGVAFYSWDATRADGTPAPRRYVPAAPRLRQGARRPAEVTGHPDLDLPGGHPGPLTAPATHVATARRTAGGPARPGGPTGRRRFHGAGGTARAPQSGVPCRAARIRRYARTGGWLWHWKISGSAPVRKPYTGC